SRVAAFRRRIRFELGDAAVAQAVIVTPASLPLGGFFTLLEVVLGGPEGGFFRINRAVTDVPGLGGNPVKPISRPESRCQRQQDNQHPRHSSDAHRAPPPEKEKTIMIRFQMGPDPTIPMVKG